MHSKSAACTSPNPCIVAKQQMTLGIAQHSTSAEDNMHTHQLCHCCVRPKHYEPALSPLLAVSYASLLVDWMLVQILFRCWHCPAQLGFPGCSDPQAQGMHLRFSWAAVMHSDRLEFGGVKIRQEHCTAHLLATPGPSD